MNDDYESFVPTQADIRPENASWFLDEGDDGAYLTIEVECESLEDKDNEALLDDYVHVAVEWFPLPGNNVDAVVGKRLQSNIFGGKPSRHCPLMVRIGVTTTPLWRSSSTTGMT